ncbi:MAG: trans-2-enoyl-CoA reductase [Halieaceae bacterium]
MKLVRYSAFGPPDTVLEVVEVPIPEPASSEVRIRVEASPIHLADLKHINGVPWFDQYKPPYTPGYEGVGRVSAVGSAVQGVAEGDRVFLPVRFGAWAEEVIAPAQGLWMAPEAIDAVQLALVPINFSTAYLMLREVVQLSPGDWVVQNAANSNVGYYLIKLCRRWGLDSANVVRRESALPALEAAGGSKNFVDGADLSAQVRAVIPPGKLKLAIDAVAGDATARLASCFVDSGGVVLSYGMLSGDPCSIPPEMLMLDDVMLKGFYAARTIEQIGSAATSLMHEEINTCLVESPPEAQIAATYSYSDVREAVQHAARTESDREGKIVLVNE